MPRRIHFYPDPPVVASSNQEWGARRDKATSDIGATFRQRRAAMAAALRRRRPHHTVKRVQTDLAGVGAATVGGNTIKGWISASAPQWPSGRHLTALVEAYGLGLLAEVFAGDPEAEMIRAKFEVSRLLDELSEVQRLLEGWKAGD